mgnify:CR=1 FL=1
MQVKDILKVKGNALLTVNPQTPLSEAVITMSDHDIGSGVVLEQGRFAGMLTFREIINVLAKRQKEHRIGPTPPIALGVPEKYASTTPCEMPMASKICAPW